MSYKELFDHRQRMGSRITHQEIFTLAKHYSGQHALMIKTPKLTSDILRGYFLSAAEVARFKPQFAGRNIIYHAADNRFCWTRMVCIKESMHLFDDPSESTSSAQTFAELLLQFRTNQPDGYTREYRSEIAAVWMALGLFCLEPERAEFARQRAAGEITDDMEIAEHFKVPLQYVPHLFGDSYGRNIDIILDRKK